MPIDTKKNQKTIVVGLRRQGFSYSEIQKELALPKSTIASWSQNVTMDVGHEQRLQQKRSATAQKNNALRKRRTAEAITAIKKSSSHDIRTISKRELWLMGITLYWKNISSTGRVQFTSAEPDLIKLFLRWLQEVGRLKKNEFLFDIFLGSDKQNIRDDAIGYWSKNTGFDTEHFSHVYLLRRKKKRVVQRKRTTYQHGLLRIRVRASSLLARQIAGWIEGIKTCIILPRELT